MTGDDGRPLGLTWRYDKAELIADGIVHGVGVVAFAAGAGVLVAVAALKADAATVAAVAVYAATLLALIGASAAYNLWPISRTKWILRRIDRAAIYGLIAGTYTPFMIHVSTPLSLAMLAFVWAVAVAGALAKIAAPARLDRWAFVVYMALSWSGLLVAGEAFAVLPTAAVVLLVAGGVLYSAGVVFHLWESLRFQNAIWHGFVVAAASCQYGAVLSGVALG